MTTETKLVDIVVRDRRQVTLPSQVCELLGIHPGDHLTLTVNGDEVVLRSRAKGALDALAVLRKAVAESGVSEDEMQAEGRHVRKELLLERYGIVAE